MKIKEDRYNLPNNEKLSQCPLCGCTNHKWIGCVKHWQSHKKNKQGQCESRNGT